MLYSIVNIIVLYIERICAEMHIISSQVHLSPVAYPQFLDRTCVHYVVCSGVARNLYAGRWGTAVVEIEKPKASRRE